jgi:hypothetical protein
MLGLQIWPLDNACNLARRLTDGMDRCRGHPAGHLPQWNSGASAIPPINARTHRGDYYEEISDLRCRARRLNITCAAQTITNSANKLKGIFFGDTVAANCGGDFNLVSAVLDYAWTKHLDTYLGANYSEVSGGFASGNLQHNSTLVTTGARLKF